MTRLLSHSLAHSLTKWIGASREASASKKSSVISCCSEFKTYSFLFLLSFLLWLNYWLWLLRNKHICIILRLVLYQELNEVKWKITSLSKAFLWSSFHFKLQNSFVYFDNKCIKKSYSNYWNIQQSKSWQILDCPETFCVVRTVLRLSGQF